MGNGDLFAFHAAVAKITYDERTEIVDIYKIIEIHKKDFIYINKARIMKFHEELKDEIQVEEEVFEKCFQDFYDEKIKPKMQREFNLNLESFKEDFKEFFYNRKQTLNDDTRKVLDENIQHDLSKDVSKRFIGDATRTEKKVYYRVLKIENGKICFDEKHGVDLEESKINEQLKAQCQDDLQTFKGELKKALRVKKVNNENIGKFTDFIVFLCSQVAEVDFLKNLIIPSIFREGEQFITGFDLKKDFLDIQIEIVDNKTLKMIIEAKDSKKLFTTQKFKGLGAEDWNLAIKNPKSETTFELDEKGQWKVKDGKISFQIENNAKEAK